MNPDFQTNADSIAKGEMFIPFKVRNILFYTAESKMSEFERLIIEYCENNLNQALKQEVNSKGPTAVKAVNDVFINTKETVLTTVNPTPPMDIINRLEKLLSKPFNAISLKEFCKSWKDYHDVLIHYNIIPNTLELPNAYNRMMR